MLTNVQPIPAFWSWLLPFLNWLPKIDGRDLRADLIAGLTGAIVVLPQGVAFATIAGMPPQYGLYAGMIPAIVAALFGSSRHLVSGPTTAASVVLFSALSIHAAPGSADYVTLALTLTFMVGLFELALGLARMGALVNFISHSVVVGFTAGAAILIAAKQLKHFFGVEMDNGGHLTDILLRFGGHLDRHQPLCPAHCGSNFAFRDSGENLAETPALHGRCHFVRQLAERGVECLAGNRHYPYCHGGRITRFLPAPYLRRF